MKKVFCAYAFTGEDAEVVRERMQSVVEAFKSLGIEAYCNLFDSDTKDFTLPKEFITDALKKQEQYDTVFVVQASERRSEGQLIEFGAALARGKKIIVAQHKSAVDKSYVHTLADTHFEWNDQLDLVSQINKLVDKK